MKSSTNRAQVANNQSISLSSALRANTPPTKGQTTSRKFLTLSIFLLLSFFTTNAWGADVILWNGSNPSYQASATEKTSTDGAIKWKNSAGNTYSNPTRIYSGNTLTISVANTNTTQITKIVAECTTTDYASAFGGTSVNVTGGGTASRSVSSKTTTITITGKATKVAMQMSAQSRVSKLTVYYETAASHTVTWTINPAAGGTLSATSGNSTTVTPNAAYTYGASAYTVTSGAATVSQSGNTFTATPTANSTIQINMVEKPKYTVKFYKTSTTFESVTEASVGAGVAPPTMEEECGGWTFQGWSESPSNSETSTTELELVTLTDGKYYPTEDVNLFPVYTKSEGGGGTVTWNKVTTAPADWSGEYLIVNSDYAMTSDFYSGTSGEFKGASVIVSNNQVTSSPSDKMIWIVEKNGSNAQYSFKNKSTGTYANITGTDSKNAALSSSVIWFTVSSSSTSGVWKINSVSHSARCFAYYSSNKTFRTYDNSSNTTGSLYRKEGSGSTTYYYSYPQCTTEPTYTLTLQSGLSCVTNGSATVELNATEVTNFTAATRDGFTCSGYWSAPSGGVKVLNADGTFAATNVQEYITDGKWTNEGNVTLTPRWECSNTMTLSVGTQSGGTYSLSKTSLETCDCTDNKRQVTITATPNSGYSVTDISYSGNGTATKVSGPTVNGNDTKWVYQFNQGDNGNGTFTVTFTTIPTYTITWMANGQEFHKQQDATHGTNLAVPSAPDPETYACDDKVFVGWTATPISGTIDDEPADLFTTKTAKVEEAATTYYAVFATADAGGSTTDTYDWESTSTGNWTVNAAITRTQSQGVDESYAGKINTNNTDVTYNNKVAVTNFSFDFKRTSNNENYNVYIETSTDKSTWNAVATYPMTDFGNGSYTSKSYTFDGTQDLYVRFRCHNTTATRYVDNVSITYGGTSYSDYVTTCAVIPDPVWGGAVINRNSIKVDCGSMTKLNAADPNGPATISFPAATNHTLTYDITVTASEGFRVSTNKTDAAKYGASVTVSPNKTGDNAGKITQNVYVVAVAPAMSDEDFMGTITLSGKQLAENQVIDVTADVTCTTYTLTLDDRGTKTTAEYYAGASVPKPADPEGVCTDPINYVFDGWSLDPVTDENITSYEKVTFPFDMPVGKTTLYAVYRYVEEGSGDSGDYEKVTSALDDYSGDYLIVYEAGNVAFDGGRNNVDDELDATSNTIEVTINANTIASNATTDAAKFTIAKVDGGYSIKSASGYYIGWGGEKNGLNTNSSYTVNYRNTISDNTICGKTGYLKYNKTADQKRFRYYQSGQESIALYRKAASYLYTTSPVCGPHLAITDGKDIYVTGGNAGGTRDLVIAQKKVSYKATRLNVSPTSQVPDVKVATNGITVGGVVTSDVKVTIDQTKEQQTDGTYTITGTITVQYQPSANNKQEDIQVQLAVDYNAEARDNFTVHARSLPAEFVIVAKSGDKWYALNGDMNTNAANPANGQVTLDNDANPTQANYAPCNAIYTFDGVPNTGDRTYVRFQGTDDAWLWASSGTNVGIQNNVLKTTPEGNNNAYNWKLETEDNITYKFHNDNNSRLLGLNGEKFGMYASGVQEFRILPYVEKCLYNYAPSNLKVSVLKGSYVTLTWDAVAGATKYQYRTDDTNWTDCGTEPTVTINGLTGETKYTYYVRAYHEDAGVSQECIDYAEITFTTADCDDVPTDITYTADLNSITVSWTAAAPTATITYNTKEDGTGGGGTINNATSPHPISGGLNPNTTYYIQILADGTCASPIIPVKTKNVEVDIVEWKTDGIVVDVNTNEKISVSLENEVSFGSGIGTEATELFFSKYYEASFNVKLVAIYNGTKNIIDLTDYTIQYGKTSWESNYITLKDFGAIKGQIQPGEEIILYSMQDGTEDDDIMDCVHEKFPDGNWVEVTSSNNDGKGTLSFGGDKTIILCKKEYDDEAHEYYDNIIDVIGALKNDPNEGILPTNTATEEPSWGDKEGWVCETGLSIADDSQIGISTNRCLLIRNNTVTSGNNAVTQNIDDFVTLCTEWKGAHVPDNNIDNGVKASCENFAYVGTFDYSDYYTKYVSMGDDQVFEENKRNPDGTVTISIPELSKQSCRNIRIIIKDNNTKVISNQEYKVPIMITTTQGTDGQAFLHLQENLATVEVDGSGNPTGNKRNLTLDEVREICKTCDVVVRDNATLMKKADDAANDHPQVRNIYVYENSSLIVPNGTNYTINNLSLRRKGDEVSSLSAYPDALKLPESAAAPISLDLRVDANNWHWFTLPYNCNIADVTWVDGSAAQYNVDWFLMTYDGAQRANTQSGGCWKQYNGTTIEAGKGYIVGITGDLTNPNYTFELRFPMAKEVLANEGTDKTVDVRAWGVETNIRPNHKGWNLVGNPYLAYYQRDNITKFEGLRLGELTGPDLQTGYWEQTGDVPYVVIPIEGGWVSYEQVLASETDLMPFTAYFVQVGNDEKHNSSDELSISFDHTKLQLSATPMPASIVRRAPAEIEETEEPIIVGVSLTNSKGESDKTSLVIDDRFTNEYEMNGDFFKWFGDYYNYYTKPVLYTIGADQGKRAFNALNEELAKQPIPMGMYAAQAGNYTFSLNQQFDLSRVEEVWLYDATQSTYTNLMQSDYTFSTSKVNGAGRFSLSVKLAPKVATSIDNVTADKVWATTHTKQVIVNGLESGMHLWLYDATGKLLYTEPTSNYQHTYAVPQTGTYFVSVMKGNQKQTIKVVVE